MNLPFHGPRLCWRPAAETFELQRFMEREGFVHAPESIESGEFGGLLFPLGIEFGQAALDVD
jgi:hypothetical protein